MAHCDTRREGDEIVCTCGRRWDANEPAPECSNERRKSNFHFVTSSPHELKVNSNDRRFTIFDATVAPAVTKTGREILDELKKMITPAEPSK